MSRHLKACLLIGLLSVLSVSQSVAQETKKPADFSMQRVYIGTYTGDGSKGIYQTKFDLKTGQLSPVELAAEVTSPSFLALHPDQLYLYAVMEISDFEGKKAGGVGAFAIDPSSGKLKLLNQRGS